MAKNGTPPQGQKNILTKFKDPEINAMFQKIYEMDGKIQEAVDRVLKLSGMTKEELWRHFDNPKSLTVNQLEKMEQQRAELEKKVSSILGPKWGVRRKAKKEKKLSKKRKGKTLGGRKGWISMH